MKDRIKELRKEHLHMTQQEFADRLTITRGAVAMYEVGRSVPSNQTINSICREFNVNEEWLRTGKGSPFSPTPQSVMEEIRKKYGLDDFSYELVYEYLCLDRKQRDAFRDFFYNVYKKVGFPDSNVTFPDITSEKEAAPPSESEKEEPATLKEQIIEMMGSGELDGAFNAMMDRNAKKGEAEEREEKAETAETAEYAEYAEKADMKTPEMAAKAEKEEEKNPDAEIAEAEAAYLQSLSGAPMRSVFAPLPDTTDQEAIAQK